MERERLPDDLSRVMHVVSTAWSPPAVHARGVKALRWGTDEVRFETATARLDNDELVVDLVLLSGAAAFDHLWGAPVDGELDGDWSFSGGSAYATQTTHHIGDLQATKISVLIRVSDWRLKRSDRRASRIWVGRLDLTMSERRGNLSLSSRSGGSVGHFFLESATANYGLLRGRNGKSNLLVIYEREGVSLTHTNLRRDLNALALTFASPIRLDVLWSVDEDMRQAGVLGMDMPRFKEARFPEQEPSPGDIGTRALPAVFFKCFTAHVAQLIVESGSEGAAQLTLASWHYVESVSEITANSALAKILLSALSAARHLLGTETTLTRDVSDYATWLEAHDEELASLERVGGAGLLRAQLATASQPDVPTTIALALERVRLLLVPELANALSAAVRCLFGFRTESPAFLETFPKVRAIAAALIARIVGYTGPLTGWQRMGGMPHQRVAPPSWWPDDGTRAAEYQAFTEDEPALDPGSLWPHVEIPHLPEGEAIRQLVRFTEGLTDATDGRVYAEINALPREDSATDRRYEMVLRATGRRTAKIVLALLWGSGEEITIEVDGDERRFQAGSELYSYLAELALAPATRAGVERLMLSSLDATREHDR